MTLQRQVDRLTDKVRQMDSELSQLPLRMPTSGSGGGIGGDSAGDDIQTALGWTFPQAGSKWLLPEVVGPSVGYVTRAIDPSWEGYYGRVLGDVVASVVVGTDGKDYICTDDHTSDNDKKPITGGDYADFWEDNETTGEGAVWAGAQSYVAEYLQTVVVGTNGDDYVCIRDHTSEAGNKPITGGDYLEDWEATGGTGNGDVWATATDYKAPNGLWLPFSSNFMFEVKATFPDIPKFPTIIWHTPSAQLWASQAGQTKWWPQLKFTSSDGEPPA